MLLFPLEVLHKKKKMVNNQWSNLPQELLQIIGHKLDSRIDVFRFRSVCSSWRSSLSPSFLSFHLSPLFSHFHLLQPSFFFTPFTISCLQLSNPPLLNEGFSTCLVKVLELPYGQLKLVDTLSSSSKVSQLIQSGNTSKTINLLNFRLIELYKGYHLQFKDDRFQKKLFSRDQVVLGISDKGKLGFRKLEDSVWANLGTQETRYDDIILYRDQFYVIDNLGEVSWINQSLNLIPFTTPLLGCGQLKNLIESEGKLYAIDCYIESKRWLKPQWKDDDILRVDRDCARVDMRVYMLDEEWGTWVHVKSLGNRVFVLGKEYSFSMNVSDFPEFEGNQIYFMEPQARDMGVNRKGNCYVLWVFRLDDRRIDRVCRLPCHSRFFSLSLNWPRYSKCSSLNVNFELDL